MRIRAQIVWGLWSPAAVGAEPPVGGGAVVLVGMTVCPGELSFLDGNPDRVSQGDDGSQGRRGQAAPGRRAPGEGEQVPRYWGLREYL